MKLSKTYKHYVLPQIIVNYRCSGRLAVRIRKTWWQALRIAPQWYLNHALRIAHSDTQVMHLELYQPLVAPNHPFLKDFPLKIIHFWWIPPGSVLRSSSVFPANCEVFHRLNLDLNRWIQTKLPKSTLNIQHTHTTWTYTTHTHIYI